MNRSDEQKTQFVDCLTLLATIALELSEARKKALVSHILSTLEKGLESRFITPATLAELLNTLAQDSSWPETRLTQKIALTCLLNGISVSKENIETNQIVTTKDDVATFSVSKFDLFALFDNNRWDVEADLQSYNLLYQLDPIYSGLIIPEETLDSVETLHVAWTLRSYLTDKLGILTSRTCNLLPKIIRNYPEEGVAIIQKVRDLKQNHILSLKSDDLLSKDYYLGSFFPEKMIVSNFETMERIDGVNYPTEILDPDKSGIEFSEIANYKQTIKNTYYDFLENIAKLYLYKKAGVKINDEEMFAELGKNQALNPKPWLLYSRALVGALFGHPEDIELLWQYKRGAKNFETNQQPFQKICENLLKFGESVLLLVDPEKFFYGKAMVDLGEPAVMGMVEMAYPNANQQQLKEHLLTEPTNSSEADPSAIEHATMVAETLLGNPGPGRVASGMVQPYVFNPTPEDNLWTAWDKTLGLIVDDIKKGIPLGVLNISMGPFKQITEGPEYEKLKGTAIYQSFQKKLGYIFAHHIPVVIAAGNFGLEPTWASLRPSDLSQFNFLATLKRRIIVVAAAVTSEESGVKESNRAAHDDEKPHIQLSDFSSRGTEEIHPTLAAPGENFTLFYEGGLKKGVDGTSFASPFVARTIAAMKEINPNLSVEMVIAILKMSAQDMNNAKPNGEGAGFLMPRYALYLAMAVNLFNGRKLKNDFASILELSFEEQTNLDWIAGRLRVKTALGNAANPGYGM